MDNLYSLLGIDLSILDEDEKEESITENKDLNIKNIFDFNFIKNNINDFSTKKICNIIVSNRYLGFNKELNIFCMTELSNRRKKGDDFLFEKYIEEEFNKLPKLKFETQNIFNIINSIRKNK